ncbi:hypothetical protein [Tenacibaculum agarivorans]|uniref:hypothetical protein n=1 Tax=Tenacibaculum agarivorans TaxID=1908389 RepID=UPI00094BB055|nr:hypothetical protein [Tenacibaculum agarivorans]
MKNIFIILFFVFIHKTIAQGQNIVMIFEDKSVSVSSEENPIQRRYKKKLIQKACSGVLTEVTVCFLSEHTASATARKKFVYKQPSFNRSYYSADELPMQQQLFKGKLRRSRKRFAKKVITFMDSYQSSARWTEILAAIVQISRNSNPKKQIFFFTDGIESSEFRQIDKRLLTSDKDAKYAAFVDVKNLRKKYKLPQKLSGVEKVEFIFPLDMGIGGNKRTSDSFLETYWRAVFALFGVKNVVFKSL